MWYKNSNIIILILGLILSISLSSCTKDEGIGGNSSIKGKLFEKVYNDDYSFLLYEHAAQDEDLYILYGNNLETGDDITTSFTGDFKFNYLFPGEYTIFYYSDDSTPAYDENTEIYIEIELDKNEELDLGDIYCLKSIDYNEGNAIIKGRVFLINYLNSSIYPNLIVKDTTLAQEHEIYLTYGNHEFYDDRIRTQFDGTFFFMNLIKGNYSIFLYSEDITGGTEDIVIMFEKTITEEAQIIDLGDIYIEQL